MTPGVTRLEFVTEGILLREMLSDPLLTRFSSLVWLGDGVKLSFFFLLGVGFCILFGLFPWTLRSLLVASNVDADVRPSL